MIRGFAILRGWADASALPKEFLTQLNTSSTLPMESLPKLIRILQSTFPGEEALRVEEKRTLWNSIVNAGADTVNKRFIEEGIAQNT